MVWILGGGPSLSDFDASVLRRRFVIGCNDAYRFGTDIVDVLTFGDKIWWDIHARRVKDTFDGPVVTTCDLVKGDPRVRWIQRRGCGLYRDNGIGWNTNTGAMSINLALQFGARAVLLLGFDMELAREGHANWHVNEVSTPKAGAYTRFRGGFEQIARALPKVFPGAVVLNCNPASKMECFPKIERARALEIYQ